MYHLTQSNQIWHSGPSRSGKGSTVPRHSVRCFCACVQMSAHKWIVTANFAKAQMQNISPIGLWHGEISHRVSMERILHGTGFFARERRYLVGERHCTAVQKRPRHLRGRARGQLPPQGIRVTATYNTFSIRTPELKRHWPDEHLHRLIYLSPQISFSSVNLSTA